MNRTEQALRAKDNYESVKAELRMYQKKLKETRSALANFNLSVKDGDKQLKTLRAELKAVEKVIQEKRAIISDAMEKIENG